MYGSDPSETVCSLKNLRIVRCSMLLSCCRRHRAQPVRQDDSIQTSERQHTGLFLQQWQSPECSSMTIPILWITGQLSTNSSIIPSNQAAENTDTVLIHLHARGLETSQGLLILFMVEFILIKASDLTFACIHL